MNFLGLSSIKDKKKFTGLITVNSIKDIKEEFIIIKNNYIAIRNDLQLLENVSVETANKIRKLSSVLPSFMGGTVNQKYGNIVQIHAAANNGNTIIEIDNIVKYIETLVTWIKDVSTITDENRINELFGRGDLVNKVGGFITTFEQFSVSADKIKIDVGNSTSRDKSLITEENSLFKTYRNIAEIVKIYESIRSPGCIEQLKNYYVSEMNKLIVANTKPSADLDSLWDFVNRLSYFNSYAVENYLMTCSDSSKFDMYKLNINKLISAFLSEKKIRSMQDVQDKIFVVLAITDKNVHNSEENVVLGIENALKGLKDWSSVTEIETFNTEVVTKLYKHAIYLNDNMTHFSDILSKSGINYDKHILKDQNSVIHQVISLLSKWGQDKQLSSKNFEELNMCIEYLAKSNLGYIANLK